MRITWIIGNGFDANLGLKTGYGDFRDRVYLSETRNKSDLRDKLVKRLDEADFSNLETARLWSDLEELLGRATSLYGEDEVDDFTETFEEMESLLTDYVHDQETRLPKTLPDACLAEFKNSIAHFDSRMAPRDKAAFKLDERSDSHFHRFISLNYTQALACFVADAGDANGLIDQHRIGNSTYNDLVAAPLYLHGAIGDDGFSRDVVFGVDSAEQLANGAYAAVPLFVENWVKPNRNDRLFGNENERDFQGLIGDADVFCVYGCSMGNSDGRIWRAVGQRLMADAGSKLVLFIYELPNRHERKHRKYQDVREERRAAFQKVAGLTSDDMQLLQDRIFFVPSSELFDWGGKIELAPDPYAETRTVEDDSDEGGLSWQQL